MPERSAQLVLRAGRPDAHAFASGGRAASGAGFAQQSARARALRQGAGPPGRTRIEPSTQASYAPRRVWTPPGRICIRPSAKTTPGAGDEPSRGSLVTGGKGRGVPKALCLELRHGEREGRERRERRREVEVEVVVADLAQLEHDRVVAQSGHELEVLDGGDGRAPVEV